MNKLRGLLVQAIEASGYSVSGPADARAAEDGEPAWVCNARAAVAEMDTEIGLMGNCKDCKHWHVALGHSHGETCEYPDTIAHNAVIGDDEFALYADAADDTGLEYGLKTGPMFGCLKFQQR